MKALNTARNLGLIEHMLRGGLKGGACGGTLWRLAQTASAVFPPSAPILLPSATFAVVVGASLGATIEGGTYALGQVATGKAVRL